MTTLEREIAVSPRFLTKNLEKTIIYKILQMRGKCLKDKGYITEIDTKSVKISDGVAQNCGSMVIFKTKFDVEFQIPNVKDIIIGEITEIISLGFFVEKGNFKILVSKYKIPKDIEFKSGEHLRKGDITLKKGDMLKVEIYASRYKILGCICEDAFVQGITKKPIKNIQPEDFFDGSEIFDEIEL
jgi:DNA-directed RNA polymerase subunit E'/Rpb7